ncbi:UbiA prenyltransferase family-domain-containing protein [Corynascus novoguineensis]|uniref:UbiA prenyltransferase family-domain-containing protein n=1 Tax=Corynascus novoguineensis TaxID=1126955 RepID=A0AAN7HJW0_9PEZI|nr:UbiA prenyltransferase family-domain-containing protein [Corynascus novoguineensis]
MAPKAASSAQPSQNITVSSGKADGTQDHSLAQQYGGGHVGAWVDRLPASVIPYVQLARLSPPAGLILIFLPHLFGILHAAIVLMSDANNGTASGDGGSANAKFGPAAILRACTVTFGGSFFSSNAAHAWNDLVDAPLDQQVARTRGRPIARGAISPRAAFLFTASQAMLAAAFLLVLVPSTGDADANDVATAVYYALPNILATTYYPLAKRHTHLAQVVLGFCLAYGVVIGSCAMGLLPQVHVHIPTVCLTATCLLWTVLYDTVYAHQDVVDDRRLGLKSTAVLLGGTRWCKPTLWCVLAAMLTLLAVPGRAAGMAAPYYVFALGGCAASLGAMIRRVDLGSPASCWWWFRYGFWLAGGSVAAGLVSEYVLRAALG